MKNGRMNEKEEKSFELHELQPTALKIQSVSNGKKEQKTTATKMNKKTRSKKQRMQRTTDKWNAST